VKEVLALGDLADDGDELHDEPLPVVAKPAPLPKAKAGEIPRATILWIVAASSFAAASGLAWFAWRQHQRTP